MKTTKDIYKSNNDYLQIYKFVSVKIANKKKEMRQLPKLLE